MILYLTQDTVWDYIVNGIAGCKIWPEKPIFMKYGWKLPYHNTSIIVGKKIFEHRDYDRIFSVLANYYVPGIDRDLPRKEFFNLLRNTTKTNENLIIEIDSSFSEWLEIVKLHEDSELSQCKWRQSLIDPEIPF